MSFRRGIFRNIRQTHGYRALSDAGQLDAKNREWIAEAVSVNAGAALVYSSRVLDAFHDTDAPAA